MRTIAIIALIVLFVFLAGPVILSSGKKIAKQVKNIWRQS